MKIWTVVTTDDAGNLFSFAHPIDDCSSITCQIAYKNLLNVQLCKNKKHAEELAKAWNAQYAANKHNV